MSSVSLTPPDLTLTGDLSGLNILSEWSAALSHSCQANERDCYRIELVLTEVVTNTMMYGGDGAQRVRITLEATRAEGWLHVSVVDNGFAFDPLTGPTKPAAKSLDEATPGGLGLVFIRSYTDAARYERQGDQNYLTLSFLLGAPPKSQPNS